MVMVGVAADGFVRPEKRGQRRHIAGVRNASDVDGRIGGSRLFAETDGIDSVGMRGEARKDLFTLTDDRDVGSEFAKSRAGGGGCMGARGDEVSRDIADGIGNLLRNAQLRRGASPEE